MLATRPLSVTNWCELQVSLVQSDILEDVLAMVCCQLYFHNDELLITS